MKKAVLFVNIGSPDTLDPADVKKYLTNFLMDPRVINYPYWLRYLLFQKFIIPKRVPNSKEAYEQVWTSEGSPLLVYTKNLIAKLNAKSGPDGYEWFWAMRYSKPSIESELKKIIDSGIKEILIFPAYPQFADSSTTSTLDAVKDFFKTYLKKNSWDGKVSYVQDFFKNAAFIANVVEQTQNHLSSHDEFQHYLFSFHGLPESHMRAIHKSCEASNCTQQISEENRKCYKAQCYQTAKAVAQRLGIADRYSVAFQSRLGPSKWIEPYTDVVVEDMARQGQVKSLAVFSLAFVTDCLETLEELDMRLKDSFLENGGQRFFRVPCLNENFESVVEVLNTEPHIELPL